MMDSQETTGATGMVLPLIDREYLESTMMLVGHDLRSPVTVIISGLQVLISLYEAEPEMAGLVDVLRGALYAATREIHLVTDLLDLKRLEMNTYPLKMQEVDLVGLLRDVLQDEAYALATKKLKVEVALPEHDSLWVSVEAELVKRMFAAMLDNVMKFITRDDTLKITMWAENGSVITTFRDTGRLIQPGFNEAFLKRAPRWDDRVAGTRTGVGLGMPFTYHAALAQGGMFSAVSDPDTGLTTLTLTFPLLR